MSPVDEAKKAFDITQDALERQGRFVNSLQRAGGGGWIPGWWGWFQRDHGGMSIVNQKSNDWWPLVFIAAVALFLWWKPAEKPTEAPKPAPAPPVAASPSGTATWQRLRKDGTWETITSQPDKELPDGRIQTQDGRIWTRNPDGTLSEVK